MLWLNKFILHNQNKTRKLLRFDLFQRPSSEEAGTQFFWIGTKCQRSVVLFTGARFSKNLLTNLEKIYEKV